MEKLSIESARISYHFWLQVSIEPLYYERFKLEILKSRSENDVQLFVDGRKIDWKAVIEIGVSRDSKGESDRSTICE